jgi:hypothetical protein
LLVTDYKEKPALIFEGVVMLAYCDYMAKVINDSLKKDSHVYGSFVDSVGKVNWDLGEKGEFLSTKKTMTVVDRNGKNYRIVVEEI